MCRLAYITQPFAGLKQWLLQMENSLGGDGNGVVTNKKLLKGVGVTIDQIVDAIEETRMPALFHTRKTSSGYKCDRLCHPFPCKKGFLVHNGHWTEGDWAAHILKDTTSCELPSDTEVFSRIVDKLGFEKACDKYEPDGVWMFINKKGKLSVYKNWGSLYYSPDLEAWGSEKADIGEWRWADNGFYKTGEIPAALPPFRPTNYYEPRNPTPGNTVGHPQLPRNPTQAELMGLRNDEVQSAKETLKPITKVKHSKSQGPYHGGSIDDWNNRQLPEYYKNLSPSSNFAKVEGSL